MKIAIKIDFFQKIDKNISNTPNSVAAVAYMLTEELVKRKHDVTVFVTSDSTTSAQIAANAFDSFNKDIKLCIDYAVGKIKENDPKHKYYQTLYQTYVRKGNLNIVEQAKSFDIIHTHEWNVGTSIAKYVKEIPVPVVTTLHGAGMKYGKVASNHSFIAISEAQKKLNQNLPILGIAYNGIIIEDFAFSEKHQDYMAFLGRITPIKGVLEAIEVAKKTGKKLIIAGALDQNHPVYIKKFLKAIEGNPNVQYMGEVGKKERNSLLKHASVLLMPIQWEEPFGLVAIESMACGTPVIALKRGALPEIVKNGVNGFIVNNLDQMCDKAEEIHTISQKKCREYVEKHFTIKTMTDAYENIYKQLVSGQR